MCWVSFVWQLKRIEPHVMFKKVRQWHPDKCEQILKRNLTQSDVLMAKGTVHLLPQVFRGYVSGVTHLCLYCVRLHSSVFACLSFFTSTLSVYLCGQSVSFPKKKKKKRRQASIPPSAFSDPPPTWTAASSCHYSKPPLPPLLTQTRRKTQV